MATSSRCLLPSQSVERSSLDMRSVPRVKSYLNILLWKASTGRKLTFSDIISRDTRIKIEDLSFLQPWQIRLFGAKMWVKSQPRPQDDDDGDDDDDDDDDDPKQKKGGKDTRNSDTITF